MSQPAYPKAADLQKASPRIPAAMREFLHVPVAPPAVQDLLRQAPQNPWLRLDFLRDKVARWWLPDDVVFIAEVPKTSVGKFDKKVLRERFKDHGS